MESLPPNYYQQHRQEYRRRYGLPFYRGRGRSWRRQQEHEDSDSDDLSTTLAHMRGSSSGRMFSSVGGVRASTRAQPGNHRAVFRHVSVGSTAMHVRSRGVRLAWCGRTDLRVPQTPSFHRLPPGRSVSRLVARTRTLLRQATTTLKMDYRQRWVVARSKEVITESKHHKPTACALVPFIPPYSLVYTALQAGLTSSQLLFARTGYLIMQIYTS
jgi:hypothetical protein